MAVKNFDRGCRNFGQGVSVYLTGVSQILTPQKITTYVLSPLINLALCFEQPEPFKRGYLAVDGLPGDATIGSDAALGGPTLALVVCSVGEF